MNFDQNVDLARIRRLFGTAPAGAEAPPGVSIIIPVNAQGDLENVLHVIDDIARYEGRHSLEMLLVVNNFEEGQPPAEAVAQYRDLGLRVVAVPSVRRRGEAIGFSARVLGICEASSEQVLLFDADCRIPDATGLIDWYMEQLDQGADCAYTHVAYYDYEPAWDLRLHFALHHLARWVKRVLMRIPTTRGSNYAVRRTPMLEFYDAGLLADEMNTGPAFKRAGRRVAYSGASRLRVYTSGRMFKRGLLRKLPYYKYRFLYNLRVLPGGPGVRERSGREKDPVRRYTDNRPHR
ncbi:MAG: glycosyltransferase [Deltaproteobacteria bacterium]|nr:glycosyltransferase [Deltaproteobacteria bacterium]MBW2360814.1 glycosyltransferase [Deltaproteobacteria bacterium]